jgi:hypothetical protein
MELVWLVYGISLLENMIPLLGMICTVSVVGLITSIIYSIEMNPQRYDSKIELEWKVIKKARAKKIITRMTWALVISSVLLVVIPSKKTIYVMLGAYAAQKLSENEDVKTIGGKVYTIINSELDEYFDKALKKKKE